MGKVNIENETEVQVSNPARNLAAKLMETVPLVMYHIRSKVLHNGETVTSLPQTRVLAFIHNCPGSSLSRLADSLAVTRATASTMVDKLVRAAMVVRTTDPTDRRNIILSLTKAGEDQLLATRRIAIAEIAELVKDLPAEKLAALEESLGLLKEVFSQANADQVNRGERRDA